MAEITALRFPGCLTRSGNYVGLRSALNGWKTAHKSLINAIQTYVAASVVLSTACTEFPNRASQGFLVEDTLITIGSGLEDLEDKLDRVRMSLTTMRNSSWRLVRANALPQEVLGYIFELSGGCCVRDDDFSLHHIVGVCAHWRRVAMDTPDLWTHVDVRPDASANWLETMLRCTR
ncbi:hypothetical protein FRC12_017573, partial [Ceratobasidium sp. 428]